MCSFFLKLHLNFLKLFYKKLFLLSFLTFCIHTVCRLQNVSQQLTYNDLVKVGDQLAGNYKYKEAKQHYLSAISSINSKHKEFSKLKLKIWEINHKLFIFESDSI